MEPATLSDVQTQVLTALVEGYRAREGMKDRIRALNEWEIARRAGLTESSYAEFFDHPSREPVLNALMALQRHGLASVWERGVKYDTFIPTAKGEETVLGTPEMASASDSVPSDVEGKAGTDADPVLARLDEIIRLLRSLDAKLGGR
jgi:hypothetical protein